MNDYRSNIILNDRMTSVIRDVNRALDGCIDAMEQMQRTGSAAFDPSALRDLRVASDQAAAELDAMEESLKSAGAAAEDSEGKFGKAGAAVKAIGAAAGAAAVAAGAAAFKLGKEVVSAYAEYEQLVGGVETLFGAGGQSLEEFARVNGKTVAEVARQYNALKDAEDTVLHNAAAAYKTAGLSANAYMETVTGFSASLIQSLGGDTAKAAKYADMAIIDMADNANKMGTDMASIQNAYQGFAKQNYTMLDNLKLGYGGTKEEMERLLEDAQKLSGQTYDISSYADIVDAIHVVQTEMGITGTTAKEAEGTISGSINMLKASFQNLLTGLGNPEADVKQLAENVVASLDSVIGNIVPVLENLVSVLPTAASALVQGIADMLPNILDAVTALFSSVLSMLVRLLPKLMPHVTKTLLQLVKEIVNSLPALMNAATQVVVTLVQGIAKALPELIPMAVQAIVTLTEGLIDNLPLILDAGLQLITGLAQGILASYPVLYGALPELIGGIVDFLLSAIPQIIQCGIDLLTALVGAMPQIISAIVTALPQIITGIISALLNHLPEIVQAGFDLLVALIEAMPEIILEIVGALPELIKGILDAILSGENLQAMLNCGYDLLMGMKQGIENAAKALWESVKGLVSGLIDGAKDLLGIGSPSKVFREIGGYTMEGFSLGIARSGQDAVYAVKDVMNDVQNAANDINTTANIGAQYTGLSGSFGSGSDTDYSTMRSATVSESPAVHNTFTFDLSGMQNSIASGNDIDDLITRFTDGVADALRTTAGGVY
ncbi:MAG: phage tail protein [Clostridia bacterium]|nr:phage tail protein [Clostridia bacterium]